MLRRILVKIHEATQNCKGQSKRLNGLNIPKFADY